MLKYVVLIIFAALAFVCAQDKTLIDLDVSDKRVIGRSKGLSSDRETLRKEALEIAKGEADILVKIDFFYEEDGDSLKVTVTGFPAYYSAASSADSASENSKNTEIKTDAKSEYQTPPSINSQPAEKDGEQKNTRFESGLYASLKAASAIPWSSIGGNVQVGYFIDRIFMGVDFGVGKGEDDGGDDKDIKLNYYSGGVSFAGRIKPNDFFQIIIGGNAGAYSKFDDDEREFIFAYGPVAKFLFGNTRIKLEVLGKFVIGYSYASMITEFGVTYAP